MDNHWPTMTVEIMFSEYGRNARGRFCTTCGFRIENPIHKMKEEVYGEEKTTEDQNKDPA